MMIDRLTRAFAIALEQAGQMHRNGRDQQAVAAVLAVAREILHATQLEMSERKTQGGEADFAAVVAGMHEGLDATVTFVSLAPQRRARL